MTNAEMFEQVFKIEPDTRCLVPKCPDGIRESACPFYEEFNGCHCEDWWDQEYK